MHCIEKTVVSGVPHLLKADKGPLNMEDIISDNTRFAVLHQKLKTIFCPLNILFMQHVLDQSQIHILC